MTRERERKRGFVTRMLIEEGRLIERLTASHRYLYVAYTWRTDGVCHCSRNRFFRLALDRFAQTYFGFPQLFFIGLFPIDNYVTITSEINAICSRPLIAKDKGDEQKEEIEKKNTSDSIHGGTVKLLRIFFEFNSFPIIPHFLFSFLRFVFLSSCREASENRQSTIADTSQAGTSLLIIAN